jgi:hypothetical protein
MGTNPTRRSFHTFFRLHSPRPFASPEIPHAASTRRFGLITLLLPLSRPKRFISNEPCHIAEQFPVEPFVRYGDPCWTRRSYLDGESLGAGKRAHRERVWGQLGGRTEKGLEQPRIARVGEYEKPAWSRDQARTARESIL